MQVLHLIIRGRIPSKKNSTRNFGSTRLFSLKFKEWKDDASLQLLKYKNLSLEGIEIQFEFYMPDNRKTDLDNKVTSVFDLLKDLEIIKDDCWQILPRYQVNTNGIDKINPRVELWIRVKE